MDTKNYTQVLIDGKIYTLGGSEDEGYLQKAASYVNDKHAAMRRLPGFTKQSADYQMAMLELNMADDYFKALERAEKMERQQQEMEKETYSLKHELVSTQMKLEAVLKDLEDRQRQLEELKKKSLRLEEELAVKEELLLKNSGSVKDQKEEAAGEAPENEPSAPGATSEEELARKALQAARKAGSHKVGYR